MKLKWGPLSSIVSFFADPSLRKRSGLFTPKAGKVAIDDGNDAVDPKYLTFKDGDPATGELIVDSSKDTNDQKGQSRDGNDGNHVNGGEKYCVGGGTGMDKDDNDSITSDDVQEFGMIEPSMKIINEEKNGESNRDIDREDMEAFSEGDGEEREGQGSEIDGGSDGKKKEVGLGG